MKIRNAKYIAEVHKDRYRTKKEDEEKEGRIAGIPDIVRFGSSHKSRYRLLASLLAFFSPRPSLSLSLIHTPTHFIHRSRYILATIRRLLSFPRFLSHTATVETLRKAVRKRETWYQRTYVYNNIRKSIIAKG